MLFPALEMLLVRKLPQVQNEAACQSQALWLGWTAASDPALTGHMSRLQVLVLTFKALCGWVHNGGASSSHILQLPSWPIPGALLQVPKSE